MVHASLQRPSLGIPVRTVTLSLRTPLTCLGSGIRMTRAATATASLSRPTQTTATISMTKAKPRLKGMDASSAPQGRLQFHGRAAPPREMEKLEPACAAHGDAASGTTHAAPSVELWERHQSTPALCVSPHSGRQRHRPLTAGRTSRPPVMPRNGHRPRLPNLLGFIEHGYPILLAGLAGSLCHLLIRRPYRVMGALPHAVLQRRRPRCLPGAQRLPGSVRCLPRTGCALGLKHSLATPTRPSQPTPTSSCAGGRRGPEAS